ncbi:MAG: hypothetical protein AAF108_04605 [Planctomycetota bacterium]
MMARRGCAAVGGRLEGPACEFFPNGELRQSRTYRNGRAVGQILDFFPNGDMKLRVIAGGRSPNGGTLVGETVVGFYEDGAYRRRELGTGRMQFIFENGTTNATNDSMPVEAQTGYMLFYDTILGGQDVYTTDSRTVDEPA